MNTEPEIKNYGFVRSFEISEHESFLGLDPRPIIDLKLTVKTDDGDTIEFVAFDHDWEWLIKALAEGIAEKDAREKEEEREAEEQRVNDEEETD